MKYQQLGKIALFREITKEKAEQFLRDFPQFKTVAKLGRIKGKKRRPELKVIAGDKNTETIHKDSGYVFKLNAKKIMWSKGNHGYRQELMAQVKEDDVVIDMFAGIGYWSIPIADKVEKVYAIDLNPLAFKYLEENIRLNRVSNITPIKGNAIKVHVPEKGTRIIMGLIPSAERYIDAAVKFAKKGAIIHYHGIGSEDPEVAAEELKEHWKSHKVRKLQIHKVKEYAPRWYHYVLDLKLI